MKSATATEHQQQEPEDIEAEDIDWSPTNQSVAGKENKANRFKLHAANLAASNLTHAPKPREMTLRQLVTHTSGIGCGHLPESRRSLNSRLYGRLCVCFY